MPNAIQIFKRKLTNLSSANPYLWMRRLRAEIFLDVAKIEEATSVPAWNIINEVLAGKKSINLAPMASTTDALENKLTLDLSRLVKKQKLTIQERGTNDLHLAFPFVLGQWPDGSWVKTPLLLIPVSMKSGAKHWQLFPNLDEALINPAFLLAYAFHFKQDLEHDLFEILLDIEATDGLHFLTQLYEILKKSRLEIHFNQTLFSSHIQRFTEINKLEMPAGFQPGTLKLQPEAVLGLFPQSDSILIPDFQYLENESIEIDSIFFKQSKVSIPVFEKNLLCPLPIDGSQEECIRTIKSGKSLLVQGPPGTGKSQLITNLMADAMGSGLSVLLVCQKKVALEVVLARLSECGLSDFAALWADFKNDKSHIFKQIANHIESIEQRELADSNLNTLVLERNFLHVCQTIDQLTLKLEEWRSCLIDTSISGISPLELYQNTPKDQHQDFSFKGFVQMSHSSWLENLEWIRQNWDSVFLTLGPESPIANRSNWVQKRFEFQHIPTVWKEWMSRFSQLESEANQKLLGNNTPGLSLIIPQLAHSSLFIQSWISKWKSSVCSFLLQRPPVDFLTIKTMEGLQNNILKLNQLNASVENWPNHILATKMQLEEWLRKIEKVKNTSIHKTVFQIYTWFSNDYRWVYEKISEFQLDPFFPSHLKHQIENALEWVHVNSDVLQVGQGEISTSKIQNTKEMIQFYNQHSGEMPELKHHLEILLHAAGPLENWTQVEAFCEDALFWNSEWELLKGSWAEFFPNFDSLENQVSKIPVLIDFFEANSRSIHLADWALSEADQSQKSLILEAIEFPLYSTISRKEIFQHLDIQWKLAWKTEFEKRFPILALPGRPMWEEDLAILRQKIGEKSQLVRQILKLKLNENSYNQLEYNRLGNRTTYRELYHQVTKKRLKPSMRQIWDQSGSEIRRLIPAWLATPESVSATWAMDQKFDLVIFDEASQCFAERGIPSAFRGDRLVVVGDDKQLAPHQLFSSRWDEDGEEDLLSGQDSLLDLAQQFLPQKMLTHHYRSQFPELIEFSNQHFYGGKLEAIPLPTALFPRPSAISYCKVDGLWINQQNEVEANCIANQLISACEHFPNETFGVIAFNARQQDLIERTIERVFKEEGIPIPTHLFVKNIENVQGDERDRIWFSVAYARNEMGRMVSQFGSLGQSGGENRLNVAITRARKSVVIVSSIFPDELSVSETSPMGSRLLKSYLEFAYNSSESKKGLTFLDPKAMQSDSIKNRFEFLIPKSQNDQILNLNFSDATIAPSVGKIDLHYWDNGLMLQESSLKNYFAYKYLNLTEKGFHVYFHYSNF